MRSCSRLLQGLDTVAPVRDAALPAVDHCVRFDRNVLMPYGCRVGTLLEGLRRFSVAYS